MVSKAVYTFKVTPGKNSGALEIECFYVNQKTNIVETISASSQSTPKHLKKPFGFIKDFLCISENVLEIVNIEGQRLQLMIERLTPLIDREDTDMKKTLLSFKEKGCQALVSALCEILLNMNKERNIVLDSDRNSDNSVSLLVESSKFVLDTEEVSNTPDSVTVASRNYIPDTEESYNETHKMASPSQESNCSGGFEGYDEENCGSNSEGNFDEANDSNCSDNFEGYDGENCGSNSEGSFDEANDTSENGTVHTIKKTTQNKASKSEILSSIEDIIKEVEYKCVDPELLNIPKQIKPSRSQIDSLKELYVRTPDKTQCFLGVVVRVNDEDEWLGKGGVWVNAELFIAMKELGFVGDGIICVIHKLSENSDVEPSTIGLFLNRNSTEFSAALHRRMTYQDLLRMCIETIKVDDSDRSRDHLRASLRTFAKGNKNVSLFLSLASEGNKFNTLILEFIRLFEEGSLCGQKLSLKGLSEKSSRKRKQSVDKIEVPLSLFKLILKVAPNVRDSLLNSLIEKEISLTKFKSLLEKENNINDVKAKVEVLAGKPFELVRESHPNVMADDVLEEFCGAKSQSSGQNELYSKLVNHVNSVLNGPEDNSNGPSKVEFIDNEKLSLIELRLKLQNYDVGVLFLSTTDAFNSRFMFAFKENILMKGAGVFICMDETKLRNHLKSWLCDDDQLMTEYVYYKLKKPVLVNGFLKDFCPIAIVGRESVFQERQIKTFIFAEVNEALPIVCSSLLDVNSRVIYVSEADNIDLDPNCYLAKKNVTITYMISKSSLEPFSQRMGSKIISM